MANVLIVEDEIIAARELERILVKNLGHEVTGIVKRLDEAVKAIKENRPDVILLDINLNGPLDGIDLIQMINRGNERIPFVYTTAYSDSATIERAKLTYPDGFIVKPYRTEDINAALEIALYNKSKDEKEDDAHSVYVKEGNSIVRIDLEKVDYIESRENYVVFHIGGKQVMTLAALKDLGQKLKEEYFSRIHRSYMVNTKRVDKVLGGFVVVGDNKLPLGKAYKDDFLRSLDVL